MVHVKSKKSAAKSSPKGTTEDALIERIGRRLAAGGRRAPAALRLGIGDDAAILRPGARNDWVVSTDFSLENVHFRLDSHPAQAIGYRALARAASDLAAMGAEPEFFLLSLSLPQRHTGRWLDQMLSGMAAAARQLRLHLVGGDTTRWPMVAMAITVIGRVPRGRAVRRDGARPGDHLYVSGRLGAAALGLALISARARRAPLGRRDAQLLRPHFYPAIPVDLGIHLAKRRIASAMMDLSDGLSTDLTRLVRASGVGARLFASRLPMVRVPAALARLGLDPLKLALDGGEDYGLLFTVHPSRAAAVPRSFFGTTITRIGEIIKGRGVHLVDAAGRAHPLSEGGWDPFRKQRGTRPR
ncbi:MAG: thiamine-phosphate kinase [Acidobacteriota bacterium]|nr:thiamine-phosphate kinase [Acidobacteriota bacterium]